MTIIEPIVAVAILATVFLGLVIVYLFGLDASGRTAHKLRLHRAGTYAINELTRSIHLSDSIVIRDNTLQLFLDGIVIETYNLKENTLYKNTTGEESSPVLPGNEQDSIIVDQNESDPIFALSENGTTVQIGFIVESNHIEEAMVFETTVYPRNVKK